MSSAISVLRKRWLALAAIVVLLVVALATGTLFAANERQQSESQIVAQRSVTDAADPGRAADFPAAPPAPERVPAQSDNNDEEEIDLPPIAKAPPTYPNLDSNLNRLAEQSQAAGQQPDTTGGSAQAAALRYTVAEPLLVTFGHRAGTGYCRPAVHWKITTFSSATWATDWIEAHVPPALLAAASKLSGVRQRGYRQSRTSPNKARAA